uniref:Uncharacterized protein n=1 Tax=Anguilla anguilla TaxID=7936 RepID=A0A0E9USM7_ANGAN
MGPGGNSTAYSTPLVTNRSDSSTRT